MQRLKKNRHYVFATLGVSGLLAAGLMSGSGPLFDSPDSFVLLAKDQITIGSDLVLSSGNLGVNSARGRITVGSKGAINGDLFADTIILGANNSVNGAVTAKRLTQGSGTEILGETSTAFSSPLVSPFPTVPDFTTGTQNLTIRSNTEETIAPGSYRNISAGSRNTLTFTGGVYNIDRLAVGSNTTLVFQAPTTLNIMTAATFGSKTVFSPISTLEIRDVKINVNGKTIAVGSDSFVSGTIIAPDAEITLGSKTTFRGQVVGQRIVVGSSATLSRDPTFITPIDAMRIVTDRDGTVFVVDIVLLNLVPEATLSDAQEIATQIGGKVTGIVESANTYQIEISATTVDELSAAIDTIRQLTNPLVEGVFRSYIMEIVSL